jgi:hypothetical protein
MSGKSKKGRVVRFHTMKAYKGIRDIALFILNHCTGGRPLDLQERRRLGGLQIWFGYFGDKAFLPLLGINPRSSSS